jgi:hypothetical protein
LCTCFLKRCAKHSGSKNTCSEQHWAASDRNPIHITCPQHSGFSCHNSDVHFQNFLFVSVLWRDVISFVFDSLLSGVRTEWWGLVRQKPSN